MKTTHMTLIGCIAFAMIGCDKIGTKSKRSSGQAESAAEAAAAEDADATAAEGAAGEKPADAKTDPAMALSGKDLYTKLCASCHQDLDKSDVGKTPLVKLKNAIATEPTMAGLKDTTDKDLEAIVAALSEISPGKGKAKNGEAEEANEEPAE